MTAQVKICGLTRPEDAAAAEAAGAAYGGVILVPGSPRTVSPARVLEIFAGTGLTRCGVFVNEKARTIVQQVQQLQLGVVQLHGDEEPEFAAALADEVDAAVWKAVRPSTADEFVRAVEAYDGVVDGLLLDGWSAAARGGTGARFPWREVAAVRDRLGSVTRLIAAGGLSPNNIGEVVALLEPDIVDVSSGVEASPGVKDNSLIRRFAEAAQSAGAQKGVG